MLTTKNQLLTHINDKGPWYVGMIGSKCYVYQCTNEHSAGRLMQISRKLLDELKPECHIIAPQYRLLHITTLTQMQKEGNKQKY